MPRPTSPGLEQILEQPFPVLDHGFIRVVDYMGNDDSIVQAARVSYGKGTKTVRDDVALIHYLMRHRHTGPFEMVEIKFHVKLPIFVARQWIRHRTANVNESSGRYSVIDDEFYLPEAESVRLQSSRNKQGSEGELELHVAQGVRNRFHDVSGAAFAAYSEALGLGVARELARTVLPLNAYTQWYWKIDLHNLLHFLKLRTDRHAQAEIRAYATVLEEIVASWVPRSFEAYVQHVRDAVTVGEKAFRVLARRLGPDLTWQPGLVNELDEAGVNAREIEDLLAAIARAAANQPVM